MRFAIYIMNISNFFFIGDHSVVWRCFCSSSFKLSRKTMKQLIFIHNWLKLLTFGHKNNIQHSSSLIDTDIDLDWLLVAHLTLNHTHQQICLNFFFFHLLCLSLSRNWIRFHICRFSFHFALMMDGHNGFRLNLMREINSIQNQFESQIVCPNSVYLCRSNGLQFHFTSISKAEQFTFCHRSVTFSMLFLLLHATQEIIDWTQFAISIHNSSTTCC